MDPEVSAKSVVASTGSTDGSLATTNARLPSNTATSPGPSRANSGSPSTDTDMPPCTTAVILSIPGGGKRSAQSPLTVKPPEMTHRASMRPRVSESGSAGISVLSRK